MAEDFLSQIAAYKQDLVARQKKYRSEASLRRDAEIAVERRGFIRHMESDDIDSIHIIAEIKRASPSKGVIRDNLDAAATAAAYQQGGASAISVLTEDHFFKGSVDDLIAARRAATLPVLRKDFTLTTYQIYESAVIGADAILLIVRMLSKNQLKDYMALCDDLNLDALVEIHSAEDIRTMEGTSARLIGINNRNLQSFDTDIKNAMNLVAGLLPGQIPVAASAIQSRDDIEKNQKAGIRHFLIGESIVRSEDPAAFIRTLKAHKGQ
ncbi:MAG: indole-3-glycerol phosphate synthase TrpC [Desulfobacteraceae bacterium]|nr:MAG: indole-3-glycerol phosphate synthase TrpC [Desulfobacteraceae bacterium]